MASLVVSTALSGPLGATLGAGAQFLFTAGALAVDAYIGSAATRGSQTNEGPRIGDIQVNGAHEGSPVFRFYGNQVRVPGFTVWASPVREVKNTQHPSSKGGSGGQFITYQARRSAAIQFGSAELSGLVGGISRVVKVFADGKLYWDGGDGSESTTYSSTGISAFAGTVGLYLGTSYNTLVLEVTDEPGMAVFIAGSLVDVSGFTGGASVNNGTWRVLSVGNPVFNSGVSQMALFNPSNSSYTFASTAAGDPVEITQKNTVPLQTAAAPDFYLGTVDQEAHRLLVEFEKDNVTGDAGDLYGMRGRVVMWLDDLLLTDYGNRLPNFEAILEVDPNPSSSLRETIKRLCASSGLAEEYVDVSSISGALAGYHSPGVRTPKSDLQPIGIGHSLAVRETGESLVFEPRSAIPTVSVDGSAGDLGVSEYGSRAPTPLEVTDLEEKSIPTEVQVQFSNSDNDHQRSNRPARNHSRPSSVVKSVDLGNLVLSADDGQKLAHQMLDQIESGRRQYSGTLSPKLFAEVQAGKRLLASNALGRSHDVYVRRLEEGVNGVLRFEGQSEYQQALTQTWGAEATPLTGSSGTSPSESLRAAPGTLWHMMDIPALRDEHRNQPGFYMAAASGSPSRRALGFVVYESTDGGASFSRMAELGREAVMGFATTLPSSSGISEETIDTSSTLRVELHDPQHKLASVTEAEMLKGKNCFLWGNEIIGVRTVTLVSTGVYDLSNLYRGARDTGDAITTHAVGDRIVQLDTQGIHFIPTNYYGIGTERHYKVVANGGIVADELAVAATLTGRNVMPFRPTLVQGARDGSDNLAITWSRAGRALVGSGHTQPLDESAELYRVSIYDGATFVKSVDGLTDASYDYSAADQATDGFSVPSDVTVRVYQRSSVLGWCRYREAVLS